MVGDVNMFLPNGLEEEGECEIMIACASTVPRLALQSMPYNAILLLRMR
jgi:hypothetical protein